MEIEKTALDGSEASGAKEETAGNEEVVPETGKDGSHKKEDETE